MQVNRGVMRIGMEIEVATWADENDFGSVANTLIQRGYMIGNVWEKTHTYHCTCTDGGCSIVRSGQLVIPPIVSATYDSTLPASGAEFITSPVTVTDLGFEYLKEIWDVVTKDAFWTLDMKDINGNVASPSIHLHVSVTKQKTHDYPEKSAMYKADILQALARFSPEFFAIADLAGVRRGLQYRLPTRESIELDHSVQQHGHHGFVQVRKAVAGSFVHIEWRLFEAAYRDWKYVQTCAYLAATLTRALLDRNTIARLLSVGYTHPYNEDTVIEAVANDDTGALLEEVNLARLTELHDICLEQLDDDYEGMQLLEEMFMKVGASL